MKASVARNIKVFPKTWLHFPQDISFLRLKVSYQSLGTSWEDTERVFYDTVTKSQLVSHFSNC